MLIYLNSLKKEVLCCNRDVLIVGEVKMSASPVEPPITVTPVADTVSKPNDTVTSPPDTAPKLKGNVTVLFVRSLSCSCFKTFLFNTIK